MNKEKKFSEKSQENGNDNKDGEIVTACELTYACADSFFRAKLPQLTGTVKTKGT